MTVRPPPPPPDRDNVRGGPPSPSPFRQEMRRRFVAGLRSAFGPYFWGLYIGALSVLAWSELGPTWWGAILIGVAFHIGQRIMNRFYVVERRVDRELDMMRFGDFARLFRRPPGNP